MFRSLVRVATHGVARAQAPARVFSRSRLLYSQTIASQRFQSTKSTNNNPEFPPKLGDDEAEDWDIDDINDDDDDDDEDYGSTNDFDAKAIASVGDVVPYFEAQQIHPMSKAITMYRSMDDMDNRYTVMLFYPADFTFVCPTELTAFSDNIKSFQDQECDVIGISTDQIHSHAAWLNLPRNQGGVEGLEFPLLADPTHEISKAFGIFDEETGQARRATVIVDNQSMIVHTSVNHAPVGRSVEEALRLVQAFKFVDEHGDQVCPANWKKGNKTMSPDHSKKIKYFESVQKKTTTTTTHYHRKHDPKME